MTAQPNKDESILNLLERLRSDLGDGAFDIVDHWDGDNFSIGLASPRDHRVLAYVATLNQQPDKFSYELELPPSNGDELYSVAAESDACTYSDLVKALCSHWNIAR